MIAKKSKLRLYFRAWKLQKSTSINFHNFQNNFQNRVVKMALRALKRPEINLVFERIRKGEYLLGIDHANLDEMDCEQLTAYLTDLRHKYQQRMDCEKSADIAESQDRLPEPIPYEVKTIDDLTESERAEFDKMNIDPADVDQILVMPCGLVVDTGGRRWIEARLGKKPVSDDEMRQLKTDYNKLLSELRTLESNMTGADIPAHGALMDKLSKIYEAIVFGSHAITVEETRRGFDIDTEAKS
jgi:hypothetical protein